MADTSVPYPDGPALLFITDGTEPELHGIDGDLWQASALSPRNRAILKALLEHALAKLDPQ